MKNPNGYGSVINLGARRRKPYAVRLTDGFIDGKQQYRYIGYYATKTEAKLALSKEQVQPTSVNANLSFTEIYNEWADLHFKRISKQLQDNYRAAYSHLSNLHNKRFTELRTFDYQKVLDKLDKSNSTKKKIITVCHQMYKYAMQNDICLKNYAEFLRVNKDNPKERKIFTDIEIEKLFNATHSGVKFADTVLILIYSGMRISEMLQLTKFQVDIDNMLITGGVKTDAGKNRIIPIHTKIQPFMLDYYNKAESILFYKKNFTPISPNYYRKYMYYPLLEKLGIERKTPQITRHTFASMLAKSRTDTLAIQKIIGHSDYSTTANIYTHPDVEYLHEQIQKIN